MGLFERLTGNRNGAMDAELGAAIERAIDAVEPRLRQFGGYPARYRHAVDHALVYARSLAGRIPGPVSINRAAYVRDPLVHALFASPDEVRTALCVSQAMRDFRRDHPEATEVYALMCMRRGSKALLGVEVEGGVLRREVPQQAIYFTDHTLADPGVTEAEARERIALGFFDSLVKHVSLRIDERKREKAEAERVRDELLARLRGVAPALRRETQANLDEVLRRLAALVESLALGRFVEDFDAVLLNPEQYLHLDRTTMVLDGVGILREGSPPGCAQVEFCDLTGRDRRRWTVALMHCDQVRDEAGIGDRLVAAQRWLGL